MTTHDQYISRRNVYQDLQKTWQRGSTTAYASAVALLGATMHFDPDLHPMHSILSYFVIGGFAERGVTMMDTANELGKKVKEYDFMSQMTAETATSSEQLDQMIEVTEKMLKE